MDAGEGERTTCAVVGGGPAGLVLALLLARAGVEVTVLEKHADFLRDFRGDTVHPSTLTALEDLGLFERFDALPQTRLRQVAVPTPSGDVVMADFGRLREPHPYVAMVPQWDLLDLLADAAAAEPTFTLRREHAVTGLLREGGPAGRVTGVAYDAPTGPGSLAADLVVACDGRTSVVREASGLAVRSFRVGFDVWWFRIPTRHRVAGSLVPRLTPAGVLIGIPRRGYLQAAYLDRKGRDAELRAEGLDAFRRRIAAIVPELAGDLAAVESLDEVKVLDVRLDRLRRWAAPGVLCLGDAAHAMSPVGGVGVNLAIQDAIAAARLLATPLRTGAFSRGAWPTAAVAAVERRRRMPTVAIQTLQRVLHRRLIEPAVAGHVEGLPAPLVRLVRRLPALTRVPATLIGVGPRPERVPGWARRPAGPSD
ncbi:FAD-dependent oxidoreductase [Nocardioides sp. CFH 31398]|uniref:FAD-dependent oxidoreductase n=1 Tax=Nocardioides sp. CFH 31398 TaxID=2919579 RepID=UPI001F053DE2|nr:FAD-dependent oxidoreductase [Nocardioides sp. CFH 31398]MCH1866182.1 FAD-dependent oxidoreductase [Nocardioides sp. CFH 31398]